MVILWLNVPEIFLILENGQPKNYINLMTIQHFVAVLSKTWAEKLEMRKEKIE